MYFASFFYLLVEYYTFNDSFEDDAIDIMLSIHVYIFEYNSYLRISISFYLVHAQTQSYASLDASKQHMHVANIYSQNELFV